MQWLNLHVSALDSSAFLGAEPVCRATWLCLMRYAIGQESGGRIRGAKTWGDRKWQQLCRVTLAEVSASCELWTWHGDDLLVGYYPADKEAEVQRLRLLGSSKSEAKRAAARINGQDGGRPKTQRDNPKQTQQEPNRKPIEGNRKERKGREGEPETQTDQPTPPLSGGSLSALDYLNKLRERDPERFHAAVGDLSTADALEVLALADPFTGWPSCLEPARIAWNEQRRQRSAAAREKAEREADEKREAAIKRDTPGMLDHARRILAHLDANPEVMEGLPNEQTKRVGLLREATAAGKPSIYAGFLCAFVPELRHIKYGSTGNMEHGP